MAAPANHPVMPAPALRLGAALVVGLIAGGCGGSAGPALGTDPGTSDQLEELFAQWRDFERPVFVDGVPDYSSGAMAAQHAELEEWRSRLHALWNDEWPVATKVDWHLVRAEMNGLDFDHRVRRPWERDPAFYVMIYPAESDVPAHEGPTIHGFIDTWTYDYPLAETDATELAGRISAIPPLLAQAQDNLSGDARDLWIAGIRAFRGQVADLQVLGSRVQGTLATLDSAIVSAAEASEVFVQWLEAEAGSRNGPSGVGKDNYTWYMRNVHLVPYSWEEQVTLMRRELARAHASMRLEENRNRDLPELERIASAQEYDRRLNESVDRYMRFLEEEEIETV
ncbi:MAG: DUF885 family protein, partial [Gemmatimonadales bacterium]